MFNFFKKIFSQEGKEKDPICGMMVDTNYFCSEHCQKQFEENPKQYIR